MSAMAADQRLRIAQARASDRKARLFVELERKFVGFLAETDLQLRKNTLFLASMCLRQYIELVRKEHVADRRRQEHIHAACATIGYAFGASSVEEFRQRLTEYWNQTWDRIPQ